MRKTTFYCRSTANIVWWTLFLRNLLFLKLSILFFFVESFIFWDFECLLHRCYRTCFYWGRSTSCHRCHRSCRLRIARCCCCCAPAWWPRSCWTEWRRRWSSATRSGSRDRSPLRSSDKWLGSSLLLWKTRRGRGPSGNPNPHSNVKHLVSRNVFGQRGKPGSIYWMTVVEGIVDCSTDKLDERKGTLVKWRSLETGHMQWKGEGEGELEEAAKYPTGF